MTYEDTIYKAKHLRRQRRNDNLWITLFTVFLDIK